MNKLQIVHTSMGFNPTYINIKPPTAQGHDWYVELEQGGHRIGMPLVEFNSLTRMVMAFKPE